MNARSADVIVTKAFFRYLRRHRSLTLLQLLGIAFGVAAAVGMAFSAQSAFSGFAKAVDFLKGGATHTLKRPAGPIEDSLLAQLMRDPAVKTFSPIIDRRIRLADGELVRVLGVDPFLDRAMRPLLTAFAASPEASTELFFTFLFEKDAVVGDSRFMERQGLTAGDSIQTSHGMLRIIGALENVSGEPLLLLDLAHAQELFDLPGSVDYVDLVVDDVEGFSKRWSTGFVIESSGDQQSSLTDMLSAFRLNLTALSLLALFVGMFLVYNTAMFTVVSRRRDAGILRSLGATRREIVIAFLLEIVLLGGLGGLAGGVLGYWLSRLLSGVLGDTISSLYFFLTPSVPTWSWDIALYGVLLGCGAGLLGGLFPLLELVKTDPAQVAQGRVFSARGSSRAGAMALCGIGVLGLSLFVLSLTEKHVYFGLAGSFFLMLGASMLTGIVLVAASPLLRRFSSALGGIAGKLAADNIRRNLGRTGVAIAAFMVALSMIVGLGLMIGSFRHSLVWWMESQLHGDLYIATESEITVPNAFYEEIKDLPGIAAFDRYRNVQITYEDVPVFITAIVADTLQRFAEFIWFEGGDENWNAVKAGNVIISESFHRRFDVSAGDTITLKGMTGPVRLTVAAVFYDYSTEHGLIMMDRTTYQKIYGDDTIDSLAVFMEEEYPHRQEVLEFIRTGANAWGLPAISREDMMGNILEVFDTTFAVTRSMRVLAVIVAFFGIAGAILILFIERQKEFGIYRSLGFSTAQVARMTLMESLGMGLVSFLLCTATGTAVAYVLIKVINYYSFNWTIFYYHLWGPYLVAAATALVASLGAALYPIFKISRTYPQMQIREE